MNREEKPLPNLGKLQSDVQQAQAAYEEATAREREASNAQTNCLNKLNSAQKALDEGIKALKDQSPRDTEWKRAERNRSVTFNEVKNT